MKSKRVMLWVFPLFILPWLALASTPSELSLFCQTKEICRPLGTDNAAKYLIETASIGDHLITRNLLSVATDQWLAKPSASREIGNALKRGDWMLAQALRSALALVNVPPQEVDSVLSSWANNSGSKRIREVIATTLLQPATRDILVEWVLRTPCQLDAYLRGLEWCWNHPLDPTARAIARRCGRNAQPNLWSESSSGEIPARFSVAELNVSWGIADGTMGRLLRSRGKEDLTVGPSEAIWQLFFTAVNRDPLCAEELVSRLQEARPVYDILRKETAAGLMIDGSSLLTAYAAASEIPQSRYEFVCQQLYGDTFQPGQSTTPDSAKTATLARWSELVAKDDRWFGFLIWHLTRPASIVGSVTLRTLQSCLAQDPVLARQAAETLDNVSLSLRQPAATADTLEFREKRKARQLLSEDWNLFGKHLGEAMNRDWNFAGTLLSSQHPSGRAFTSEAMATVVSSSTETAQAWVESMLKTDPALLAAFSDWLVHTRKIRDELAVKQWLQEAAADAARGGVSERVGQFKVSFSEFVRTHDGRNAAQRRLAIELWAIPQRLRELLANRWTSEMEGYLRWRDMASSLPLRSAGVLGADAKQVIRAVGFSQACLDACKEGNFLLDDITEPIWTRMLEDTNSPLAANWQKAFVSGPITSPLYAAAALALQDVMIRLPVDSTRVLQTTGFSGDPSDFSRLLETHGGQAQPYATVLLNDRALWRKWKSSLLSAVIFGGHSATAARAVESDPELFRTWSHELERELIQNPEEFRVALESLAKRRAGDVRYAETVRGWLTLLVYADTSNQPFFEQLYTDPTGGYRELIIEQSKALGISP